MKIRVKQDLKSLRKLSDKFSLPDVVIEQIVGKTFVCEHAFEVPARLDGYVGLWSIPAECVEIVET